MKVKQILAGTLAAAMIVTSLPAANMGSVSANATEIEVVDDETPAENAADESAEEESAKAVAASETENVAEESAAEANSESNVISAPTLTMNSLPEISSSTAGHEIQVEGADDGQNGYNHTFTDDIICKTTATNSKPFLLKFKMRLKNSNNTDERTLMDMTPNTTGSNFNCKLILGGSRLSVQAHTPNSNKNYRESNFWFKNSNHTPNTEKSTVNFTDFVGKWHDIVIAYQNRTLLIFVDGEKGIVRSASDANFDFKANGNTLHFACGQDVDIADILMLNDESEAGRVPAMSTSGQNINVTPEQVYGFDYSKATRFCPYTNTYDPVGGDLGFCADPECFCKRKFVASSTTWSAPTYTQGTNTASVTLHAKEGYVFTEESKPSEVTIGSGDAAETRPVEGAITNNGKTMTLTMNATPVASINLSSLSQELTAGDSVDLTATIAPSDAAVKDITWTSSDETIATVSSKDSDSADGCATVTAVGPGTATITATADGVSSECTVTVLPQPTGILVSQAEADGGVTAIEGELEIERTSPESSADIQVSLEPTSAKDTFTVTVEDETILRVEPKEPAMDMQSDSETKSSADASLFTIIPKTYGSTTVTISCVNHPNVSKTFTVNVINHGTISFVDKDSNMETRSQDFFYAGDVSLLPSKLLIATEDDANNSIRVTTVEDMNAALRNVHDQIQAGALEIEVQVQYIKQCTLTVDAPGKIMETDGLVISQTDDSSSVTVDAMTYITLKADKTYGEEQAVDGAVCQPKFVGWLNVDTNKYVSYASQYTAMIRKTMHLKPVYELTVVQNPILEISAPPGKWDGAKGKYVYTITASRVIPAALLPKGEATLLGHGIMTSKSVFTKDDLQNISVDANGNVSNLPQSPNKIFVSQSKTTRGLIGNYIVTANSSTAPIYAMAYAVYKDSDNMIRILYGDTAELPGETVETKN